MLSVCIKSDSYAVVSNQGLPDKVLRQIRDNAAAGYLWMAISLPTGFYAVGDVSLEQLYRKVGRTCGHWSDIYVAGIDLSRLEANFHIPRNYRVAFRTPEGWQMPKTLQQRLLRIVSRALWRYEAAVTTTGRRVYVHCLEQ